jgi:hypothetical protein
LEAGRWYGGSQGHLGEAVRGLHWSGGTVSNSFKDVQFWPASVWIEAASYTVPSSCRFHTSLVSGGWSRAESTFFAFCVAFCLTFCLKEEF